MSLLLGAIADDYTGGADLAGMLAERGVSTVQTFGVPSQETIARIRAGGFRAAVACLKSRSIEANQARALALSALDRLLELEPRQIQFKYCSTFDSTPLGNIGPVTDALMERLGVSFTLAMPALPVNGRTQYLGHLFVNGVLLSESPMSTHPLNPMTDSNLVRWLGMQTPRAVGLIPLPQVQSGRMKPDGEIALIDAITNDDLDCIAHGFADLPLVTGGSGWGVALPEVWKQRKLLNLEARPEPERTSGGAVILAGSCSQATLEQVAHLQRSGRCRIVHVKEEDTPEDLYSRAHRDLTERGAVAIVSSAPAGKRFPSPDAPARVEALMGGLAALFTAESRVRRLIVAGGETSGAVISALGVEAVEITGTIDPGVPSLRSLDEGRLSLALKSGNFGAPDFFVKALDKI